MYICVPSAQWVYLKFVLPCFPVISLEIPASAHHFSPEVGLRVIDPQGFTGSAPHLCRTSSATSKGSVTFSRQDPVINCHMYWVILRFPSIILLHLQLWRPPLIASPESVPIVFADLAKSFKILFSNVTRVTIPFSGLSDGLQRDVFVALHV